MPRTPVEPQSPSSTLDVVVPAPNARCSAPRAAPSQKMPTSCSVPVALSATRLMAPTSGELPSRGQVSAKGVAVVAGERVGEPKTLPSVRGGSMMEVSVMGRWSPLKMASVLKQVRSLMEVMSDRLRGRKDGMPGRGHGRPNR